MTSSSRPNQKRGDQIVFLTIRQLAKRWLCSGKKVSYLIKKRAFPAYKLEGQWRIREIDVLTYERTCLY